MLQDPLAPACSRPSRTWTPASQLYSYMPHGARPQSRHALRPATRAGVQPCDRGRKLARCPATPGALPSRHGIPVLVVPCFQELGANSSLNRLAAQCRKRKAKAPRVPLEVAQQLREVARADVIRDRDSDLCPGELTLWQFFHNETTTSCRLPRLFKLAFKSRVLPCIHM